MSGPEECRQMPLNNLWIGLTAKKVKIMTFENFPCSFSNFLCIIKLVSATWVFITFDCLWCYSIPYSPYTNKRAGLKIRMTFLKFWATLGGGSYILHLGSTLPVFSLGKTNFGFKSIRPKNFWDNIFFTPKFFWPRNFFDRNFFFLWKTFF